MTWEDDFKTVEINALDYKWDPVTWLFPPVPLVQEVLQRVQEQQIEAILICPWWEGAKWWSHLVGVRTKNAPVRLKKAEDCLKFPRGNSQELPQMDPLYAFHIQGKVQ